MVITSSTKANLLVVSSIMVDMLDQLKSKTITITIITTITVAVDEGSDWLNRSAEEQQALVRFQYSSSSSIIAHSRVDCMRMDQKIGDHCYYCCKSTSHSPDWIEMQTKKT